ncbi:hypothetical protein T11_17684 [Trichinella zimbabwensis]|uniref:BHLH domain-containing protein n=1 Tax=Trichinella zimbabwensis TaxID=268475 RepID=A0A0V1HKQ8_9BILA|nr:hypothetical protein T11_17684 [Trichinella zimbabwensis]
MSHAENTGLTEDRRLLQRRKRFRLSSKISKLAELLPSDVLPQRRSQHGIIAAASSFIMQLLDQKNQAENYVIHNLFIIADEVKRLKDHIASLEARCQQLSGECEKSLPVVLSDSKDEQTLEDFTNSIQGALPSDCSTVKNEQKKEPSGVRPHAAPCVILINSSAKARRRRIQNPLYPTVRNCRAIVPKPEKDLELDVDNKPVEEDLSTLSVGNDQPVQLSLSKNDQLVNDRFSVKQFLKPISNENNENVALDVPLNNANFRMKTANAAASNVTLVSNVVDDRSLRTDVSVQTENLVAVQERDFQDCKDTATSPLTFTAVEESNLDNDHHHGQTVQQQQNQQQHRHSVAMLLDQDPILEEQVERDLYYQRYSTANLLYNPFKETAAQSETIFTSENLTSNTNPLTVASTEEQLLMVNSGNADSNTKDIASYTAARSTTSAPFNYNFECGSFYPQTLSTVSGSSYFPSIDSLIGQNGDFVSQSRQQTSATVLNTGNTNAAGRSISNFSIEFLHNADNTTNDHANYGKFQNDTFNNAATIESRSFQMFDDMQPIGEFSQTAWYNNNNGYPVEQRFSANPATYCNVSTSSSKYCNRSSGKLQNFQIKSIFPEVCFLHTNDEATNNNNTHLPVQSNSQQVAPMQLDMTIQYNNSVGTTSQYHHNNFTCESLIADDRKKNSSSLNILSSSATLNNCENIYNSSYSCLA